MKRLLLFVFLYASIGSLSAQTDSVKKEAPLTIVEKMPAFPGGDSEMMKYIRENVVFPLPEKERGLAGTVYVTFVVEKDGTITDAKVLRGVPDAIGYNVEAVRVVKSMPKWNPGTQNEKTVRVQFNLPIKFTNKMEIDPKKIEKAASYIAKGKSLNEKEKYEKAIYAFDEALTLFPHDRDALYHKGIALLKLNYKSEACLLFSKITPEAYPAVYSVIDSNCK